MGEQTSETFRAVVGYDFSNQSDRALKRAIWMTGPLTDAEIHVVAALDKRHHHFKAPNVPETFEGTEEIRQRVLREVDIVLADFETKSARIFVHTRIDNAADAILEVAAEVHADMIFVGPHSKSGIKRMFVGSVSAKVTRDASCPVVVIREIKYDEESPGISPEPPCAACLKVRNESEGQTWWCEAHDHEPPYESPLTKAHHNPEGKHHMIWPYHR